MKKEPLDFLAASTPGRVGNGCARVNSAALACNDLDHPIGDVIDQVEIAMSDGSEVIAMENMAAMRDSVVRADTAAPELAYTEATAIEWHFP